MSHRFGGGAHQTFSFSQEALCLPLTGVTAWDGHPSAEWDEDGVLGALQGCRGSAGGSWGWRAAGTAPQGGCLLPTGACAGGWRKPESDPSQPLCLPCRAGFCFPCVFFNPATLVPSGASRLLPPPPGGCHTADIFSGDSWPCGTRLECGKVFEKRVSQTAATLNSSAAWRGGSVRWSPAGLHAQARCDAGRPEPRGPPSSVVPAPHLTEGETLRSRESRCHTFIFSRITCDTSRNMLIFTREKLQLISHSWDYLLHAGL